MKKASVLWVGLLLSVFFLIPAARAADKPPVRIGVIHPVTGQGANVTKSFLEGWYLAEEIVNKEGGILGGRKIETLLEDDQCIPAQSVAAVKKLIYQDKLKVILASLCSSATIADIPITKEAGVVQLVSDSLADSITEMGHPLLFRTCFSNGMLADSMSYKIAQKFKVKSIAFYAINDDFGRGLVKQTKEIFEKLKTPKVLFEGYFEQNDRDFSASITKLKGLKPEAIYLIARFPQNAQILNQMDELGFKPKIFGVANLVWDDCIHAAGKNAEGVYGIATWVNELSTPSAKKFLSAYKAKYNMEPPDEVSTSGYTGLMVAAMGIDKAGTDQDPQKIGDAIRKMTWDAPAGPLSFDAKGQGTISAFIVQVRDGKRVVVK
ncbi:MAG: ABC transporter substrate-binding protein [Thermodesulfobacteriota bacterium]